MQLFGQDKRAGFAPLVDDLLDLAPRVEKSGDPLEAEDIEQAGSRALLIDRNGHIVFYSINVDPIYEAFVEKYGLNDKTRLANASPDLEFPVGAVEFKAAWQIIDGAPPVKDFLAGVLDDTKKPDEIWVVQINPAQAKVEAAGMAAGSSGSTENPASRSVVSSARDHDSITVTASDTVATRR